MPDSRAASGIGCLLIGIFIVLGVGGDFLLSHLHNSVQTIRVVSKDDQVTSSTTYYNHREHTTIGHQYLIFTNRGVFKDTDNVWLWKWNSSDLYGELLVGRTYRCKVHGVRNHFLSGYPDLISCKQVRRG